MGKTVIERGDFTWTKKVVREFREKGGDGETLQRSLADRAEQDGLLNWLDLFRRDGRLVYRKPLPHNLNYFLSAPIRRHLEV